MSPATKTPGVSVCQSGPHATMLPVRLRPACSNKRPLLGAVEADREQYQIRGQLPLGAGNLLDRTMTVLFGHWRSLLCSDITRTARTCPVPSSTNSLHRHREHPLATLLVRRVVAQNPRPGRPRVTVIVACGRWLWVEVELDHTARALPMRHAEAVGAGVATADDHDVLAARVDGRVPEQPRDVAVGADEVVHGQMHAPQRPPGCPRHVPTSQRTGGEQHRVVTLAKGANGDVGADRAVGDEADPLRLDLGDPSVDVVLLELEVRDAVSEQAADRVVAFVHDDAVSGAGQLLGRGESGRSGADHRHPLAGAHSGAGRGTRSPVRLAISTSTSLIATGCGATDAEDAGRLTRCRTEPAGELREVVRRVQRLAGQRPPAGTDQVVPVRNPVP